jgi:hypothetical protein
MTATPRYFTGRVLKAADEAEFEYASMDDEAKFGKVFHRLRFREAIKRELLTDYQVAIVGVDDETYGSGRKTGCRCTIVRRADAQRLKIRWAFPLPIFARSLRLSNELSNHSTASAMLS